MSIPLSYVVVCDTAKVRVFKQITTNLKKWWRRKLLFAILQKYEFSSKSQHLFMWVGNFTRCLRYCKSTSFQANHNPAYTGRPHRVLFAILQKYEFSSKSQPISLAILSIAGCLRYCKSTSFQANHNEMGEKPLNGLLFAILQKYEFSSKSQQPSRRMVTVAVVCDTAKVRVFKQITTAKNLISMLSLLFAILQKYEFSSKSQLSNEIFYHTEWLFAILQKYEFSSKSQLIISDKYFSPVVCDTAKVRVFKQITTDGW